MTLFSLLIWLLPTVELVSNDYAFVVYVYIYVSYYCQRGRKLIEIAYSLRFLQAFRF